MKGPVQKNAVPKILGPSAGHYMGDALLCPFRGSLYVVIICMTVLFTVSVKLYSFTFGFVALPCGHCLCSSSPVAVLI